MEACAAKGIAPEQAEELWAAADSDGDGVASAEDLERVRDWQTARDSVEGYGVFGLDVGVLRSVASKNMSEDSQRWILIASEPLLF